MEKLVLLFEEFLMKGILMTEAVLNSKIEGGPELESFTSNRDRLLQVVDQISKQVNWDEVVEEKKSELNRKLEYIKKLDEQLIVRLQEFQEEVRQDIEKTYRQKENIKGYNLNDVK
jgi:predicted RNase H-like nuclease (RuvC/YqgF family)